MNQVYLDSARLLTRVAPLVLVDKTFALKGGTAINLFVRNMPRLSVDLDLVFSDKTLPRDQAESVDSPRPRTLPGQLHTPRACPPLPPIRRLVVIFMEGKRRVNSFGG